MTKKNTTEAAEELLEKEQTPEADQAPAGEETPEAAAPQENWEEKYQTLQDSYLRLAAEFDNYRKRTLKEKDAAYGNGRADAVAQLLPVYDNLERALNQPCEDAAYKKGIEMTMTELVKIFAGLGAEIFGNVGEEFDPNLHNAVMHIDDENLGENVIAQVLRKGFKIGEKVVRFAMVQVAN